MDVSSGRGGRGRGRGNKQQQQHGRGSGGRGNGRSGRGRGRDGAATRQACNENRNTSNQENPQQQARHYGSQRPRFDPKAASQTNQFERFILAGLQKCPPHKLTKLIHDAETLWTDCWRKVADLPIPQLRIVLAALARLPFSSDIAPPRIQDVAKGVAWLVQELADGATQQWSTVDLSDAKLEVVELVEKLFARLIKFTWKVPRADVVAELAEMLSHAERLLGGRHAAHRDARRRIESLFEELEIEWIVKTATPDSADSAATLDDTAVAAVSLGWKNPTVAWLADPSHFQPLRLPKMKVPGGLGDGVYESPAEYFDSTIKLWVGMTFVDGNNALLPHCSVKGANNKVCDQPLWPMTASGVGGSERFRCKTHRCSRHVDYMCANRNHDRGLCRLCALQWQELLRGPPSSNASTHIYDGAVTSVHYDGTVYLESVESRRPPLAAVHWKTTKRLACPNLVGIVLLESRGGSLRLTDRIYWAKVALHGDSRDEFRERERKKLALSLLTYSHDNSPNPLLDQSLPRGAAVAVIDCQTFVPEFIPVLTALEHQSAMPMSFQNGALLNLRRLPDVAGPSGPVHQALARSDDDDDGSDSDIEDDRAVSLDRRTITSRIQELVAESTLDPIVQIRRDGRLQAQLKLRLAKLVTEATLDCGQLESFMGALRFPVHCTQGPPGTGKSYLGVVVVRALLIVRQLWMAVSESVGAPPILVLSYKNHAIDEFLLDLVRKEPTMNHNANRSFSGYTPYRPLVRIGGGCSEPELYAYQEFNAASRKSAEVRALTDRIGELHALYDKVQRFRDKFAVIKEVQFVLLGASRERDDEREKRDKKACHDAALELKRVSGAICACSNALTESVALPLPSSASDTSANADAADDRQQRMLTTAQRVIGDEARVLERDDIPLLFEGIRHYDPSMDPAQILHKWMSGFVPLPACRVDECEEISDGTSDLCASHRCLYVQQVSESGVATQCTDVNVDNRKYCARHLCASSHCKHPRIAETQLFCSDHSCFVCARDSRIAEVREAVDKPPRNACAEHALCWWVDAAGFCTNLALPDASYCEAHAHVGCQAIKKDGKPCKALAVSRAQQFCRDHMSRATQHAAASVDQHAAPSVGATLMPRSKCHSTNAKGKPCKTTPLPGAKFCHAHRSKASAADVEALEGASAVDEQHEEKPVAPSGDASVAAATETESQTKSVQRAASGDVAALTTVPALASAEPDTSKYEAATDTVTTAQLPASDDDVDVLSCSSEEEADIDVDAFDFDNYDEVEESEHLQHLREVDEVADATKQASELDDSDDAYDDGDNDDDAHGDGSAFTVEDGVDGVADPALWSWEMSLATRWACVTALLHRWNPLAQQLAHALKRAISSTKRALYYEELKVKARAFEGKAVIGGTITGCVARLEAIRATNPFAILVEEASEVLEPLLFSCLCSSTCKLEMIGDHLQLQPSVMSKFDFERVNRINISMFERLIRSPPSSAVPSSVLSIQRRMRRDICDLTRSFYADITEIEDHDVCSIKTIQSLQPQQQRSLRSKARASTALDLVAQSEGRGREVLGVAPHVFFWEHTGAEERARVGLSRINPTEAEMTCSLAKYLVTCGVPPSSIAILTPYKGQLMLMRDLLMREYKLVKFTKQATGAFAGQQKPSPSCILSTVDRFQGDEADVVIISLVIDGKSRTPFVKLQNRMIVLLSRARIGMYVIGTSAYFGESPHWRATFDLLREQPPSDNTAAVNETCCVYDGARIGAKLPLCCPQHRTSTALASRAEHLKLSFCKVVCVEALPCSHACGLRCHWPNIAAHNKTCRVAIESPCVRHPRSMPCSHFCSTTGQTPIASALRAYRCDVDVDLQLPCTHEQRVACADAVDIVAGATAWPVCTERAIAPYVYAVCKHYRDCSCVEYHRFTAGSAPPCDKKEEYVAPCGHSVTLPCYRKTEVVAAPTKFVCKERVSARLPRCGHSVTVACPVAATFDAWTGAALTTPGVVYEGTSYGAKDHSCAQTVTLRRRCGHDEVMKCERTFEVARAPPPCRKRVLFFNPECGHTHDTTCAEAERYSAIVAQTLDDDDIPMAPVVRVTEGASAFRDIGLGIRCTASVVLARKCQHSEPMSCNAARYVTTSCKALVSVANPRCGHGVQIPCEHAAALAQWKPWAAALSGGDAATQQAVAQLTANGILHDTLPAPVALPQVLAALVPDCEHSLLLRRSKSCGHDVRMKCALAVKALETSSAVKVPACTERVTKQRVPCGHEVSVACSTDISKQKCALKVEKQCWNFAACRTTVTAVCSTSSAAIQCASSTVWTCRRGHSHTIQVCKQGTPMHCPTCSYEALAREIAATKALIASPKTIAWPPRDALDVVLAYASASCEAVRVPPPHQLDFYQRKLSVLERFKRSIDAIKDVWSRPVFQPKLIPIVAVRKLAPSAKASAITSFEMRDFGNASSPGIHVREATLENVEALVSAQRVAAHVVFGVAFSLGVCTDSSGLPRKGKQLAGLQAKWVGHQQDKFGFDALFTPATPSKGQSTRDGATGTLTLWEPFAAFPTHKAVLEPGLLASSLASRLPTESTWRSQSRLIAFARPSQQAASSQSTGDARPAHAAALPDRSAEYLDKLQPLLVTEYPYASGIQVSLSWDGRALCVDGETALPLALEDALRAKLQCVPASADAAGSSSSTAQKAKASGARPFAGMNYLKNITKQQPLAARDLFLALEALAIHKKTTKEAETHLTAYVHAVKQPPAGVCHPLVLLAFARLAGRTQNVRVQPTEFLSILHELYPSAVEHWCTPEEAALLDATPASAAAAANASAQSLDSLPVEDKWRLLKQQEHCQSEAMDELLTLVGLRRVKDAAFKLFKSALALQKMDAAKRKKNAPAMNYCFLGNPGTGKTTVARLFARILHDSRMRRAPTIKECTAQALKDGGASKFRDTINSAMGGVVFIDEAYELNPMGDALGKPIVAELLTVAEDKRDDLSVILAGYEDDMQQKLYKYNDGIQSRFEEIVFDDLDEADLRVVWDGLLAHREWVADSRVGEIACRRLARGAGVKGFGNARAVRKLFDRATQAAMARDDFCGILELRTVDVLGERPTTNPKLQAVLRELDDKIGWRAIKAKVAEFVEICDKNYARELNGVAPVPVTLNRLFLGNPGTGKTTCAAIYGRVLKCLNFLSSGDVVKKTASDFVGQFVGQSQTKTSDILAMAKGKVLVIDEAYNLDDNLYGKQVLDVLVEKVQGTASDDIAVVLIGYERQMLEMLRTQNPGLARRFPPQYAFYFDDYSEQELLDIFLAACAKQNVHCPLDVSELVIRQLALQKSQANFGNAGAVELILKNALANASSRPLEHGDAIALIADDVEDDVTKRMRAEAAKQSTSAQTATDPLSVLDALYRVDHIKAALAKIQTSIQVAQDEGSEIPKIGHFVFRGSPGTGKTTVARAIATIFHRMGILATDKVVETSGLNLTGEYVGQTKKRVEEQLEQARGGVLFIDEAYELGKGHFGEEAMTSLVAAMTNPVYAGMVIVIAGYPRDLDAMLDRNAGLKSRFARFVDFYDWTVDDCVAFTTAISRREAYALTPDALASMRRTFAALRALPMFGNGRDVMALWSEMLDCRAQRVRARPELLKTITREDADAAGRAVLAGRTPAAGRAMQQRADATGPVALDSARGQAPPPQVGVDTSTREAPDTSASDESESDSDDDGDDDVDTGDKWSRIARDPGVADDTWAELERAKRANDAMMQALKDAADKAAQDAAKEQLRLFVAAQERLRRLSKCPMGYVWLQVSGGWRCAGGSHFVSDAELQRSFSH